MCVCTNCSKRLFAWMMASGANDDYEKAVSDRKKSLFNNLTGNVLEIGPGTGVNLAYYPKDIHWIGIEPNFYMHSYLQTTAENLGLNIDIRTGNAENLNVESNSIDAVVSTIVMCSVKSLANTLQEVLRVLKPGGRYLFIEHVAAPKGTTLRTIQSVARPVWKVLADGCNPDRETWVAIENAGFSNLDYQHFEAPFPIVSPHIMGTATK